MMILMGILIAALVTALRYVFSYKERLDRISEIAKNLVDENNRLEERYNALHALWKLASENPDVVHVVCEEGRAMVIKGVFSSKDNAFEYADASLISRKHGDIGLEIMKVEVDKTDDDGDI